MKTFTEQSQAFCLIEQFCWLLISHVLAYLCVNRAEPAHSICLQARLSLNVTSESSSH